MSPQSQQQRLAALRHTIADIERKPALLEPRQRLERTTNANFPTLPGGLVQEVFTDALRDGGASLGFALAQAKTLMSARRPSIFYVQLAAEGQAFGLPYGPGLDWFGVDPARLVIVRTADMTEFLWAAEEMIACRSVAAVVAEVKGEPKLLNFTASRRLSLRAGTSKASLFLLRYGQQRESSAGHLRWRLTPHRSGRNAHDGRGLGASRWQVRLEKGRIAGNQVDWSLEWTKNGIAVFSSSQAAPFRRPATPFSRAAPALLADRLSQAG